MLATSLCSRRSSSQLTGQCSCLFLPCFSRFAYARFTRALRHFRSSCWQLIALAGNYSRARRSRFGPRSCRSSCCAGHLAKVLQKFAIAWVLPEHRFDLYFWGLEHNSARRIICGHEGCRDDEHVAPLWRPVQTVFAWASFVAMLNLDREGIRSTS